MTATASGELRLDACFPLAARYRRPSVAPGTVREPSARFRSFPYSERHLQCVWYDPALRPSRLTTQEGEAVEVEDAGVWNLEAGPDFLGAALRVGPERRRMAGDVEVHIHPQDWRTHGHRDDARYARVRVHVTYFPGRLPPGELPAGAVQVALQDGLAAQPQFSFEHIDLAVYPYAARAARPPCLQLLHGWSAAEKENVLDAAGQERLRRKAERLALRMAEAGADQALYEEVLMALGYKHNKIPFRRLAGLVPVEQLRACAGTDARTAYALLLGAAGLLPASLFSRWDETTRRHVRSLWDAWWKHRERWEHRMMTRDDWRLAGLRPANSPVRRLAAAAWLFTRPVPLAESWAAWGRQGAARAVARVSAQVGDVRDDYWERRWTWGGPRQDEPAALIGPDRAQVLAVNVVLPFLAAQEEGPVFPPGLLAALPAESSNALVKQTAFNLFGPHHPDALYRTGLRRQGLLQIFHDYCLNDRSRCASCAFPALLAGWREQARDRKPKESP
jgi:hypothetical protein